MPFLKFKDRIYNAETSELVFKLEDRNNNFDIVDDFLINVYEDLVYIYNLRRKEEVARFKLPSESGWFVTGSFLANIKYPDIYYIDVLECKCKMICSIVNGSVFGSDYYAWVVGKKYDWVILDKTGIIKRFFDDRTLLHLSSEGAIFQDNDNLCSLHDTRTAEKIFSFFLPWDGRYCHYYNNICVIKTDVALIFYNLENEEKIYRKLYRYAYEWWIEDSIYLANFKEDNIKFTKRTFDELSIMPPK